MYRKSNVEKKKKRKFRSKRKNKKSKDETNSTESEKKSGLNKKLKSGQKVHWVKVEKDVNVGFDVNSVKSFSGVDQPIVHQEQTKRWKNFKNFRCGLPRKRDPDLSFDEWCTLRMKTFVPSTFSNSLFYPAWFAHM